MNAAQAQRFLRDCFEAALVSANPAHCLPPYLPSPPAGRTVVIGAGKAAAAMAAAVEAHWPADAQLAGCVVTRYGHALPTQRIEVVQASHPLPDTAGIAAGQRCLELAHGLGPDDLLLVLLSGGGSALLAAPAPGIRLEEKRDITNQLLRSGASIHEINCVRKHLSALKGGRLTQLAYPARVVTLAISDVPGNAPSTIASGPTVADPTTVVEAQTICARYAIRLPGAVAAYWQSEACETPKPGSACFANSEFQLIATPAQALAAAAQQARAAGVPVLNLGDRIEGEAREAARVFAGIAHAIQAHQQPCAAPVLLLSGGETSVTIRGGGRGGRNTEFLLALALALNGAPDIYAIAADTDGRDGSEDNAGALIAPDTLARAAACGLDLPAQLADNDAYGAFLTLGDLLVTGPTRTNVNDFRAILLLS